MVPKLRLVVLRLVTSLLCVIFLGAMIAKRFVSFVFLPSGFPCDLWPALGVPDMLI